MLFNNKLFNKKNRKLVSRYILISILSYLYTFSALFFFIEELNLNQRISFIIVYGIAYILLYGIQLKYLFHKRHDSQKLVRYIASIILFYFSANVIYNLGLFLGAHYLIATALTIIILMPLRLIVFSLLVYKN